MSDAIKCDRCGECFDPENCTEEYTSIPEFYFMSVMNQFRERRAKKDLCPECTKIFKQFWLGTPLVEQKLLDELYEDYDQLLKESIEAEYIIEQITDHIKEYQGHVDPDWYAKNILSYTHRFGNDIFRGHTVLSGGDTDGDSILCSGKPSERKSDSKQKGVD